MTDLAPLAADDKTLTAYIVAVPDDVRRGILRQWGFVWSLSSSRWERTMPGLAAAETLCASLDDFLTTIEPADKRAVEGAPPNVPPKLVEKLVGWSVEVVGYNQRLAPRIELAGLTYFGGPGVWRRCNLTEKQARSLVSRMRWAGLSAYALPVRRMQREPA